MTDVADGGDDLAPVIPLFGAGSAETAPRHPTRRARPADAEASPDELAASRDESGEGWHTTWRDLGADGRRIAAVPSVTTAVRDGVRFVEIDGGHIDAGDAADDDAVAAAEARLLKALRTRSLSESEARGRLRQEDLAAELVDDVIARLVRVGAIDDAALAEQLVHVGTSRKNQGRRAIAQTMASRGIPRDVVDAALADLPDDDAERALEFARGKAQSLVRYDEATALRRLVGQLSRRGFGGSLAMSVARQALDEAGGGSRGVRFR